MNTHEESQTGKLTLNLPNVIRMLGEDLYSDPYAAVRELLQNAHDTCSVAQHYDSEGSQKIHVSANPLDLELIIQDSGAGMTEDEVRKFLTVIGSSRTDEVRKELRAMGSHNMADRLIGRFGIGLLAAFIVANKVTFTTRSRKPNSQVVKWECESGAEYRISVIDDPAVSFGTRVKLDITPEYIGLLAQKELKWLIRRYADLLRVPIYLDQNPEPINIMTAPWDHQATYDEYQTFLHERYPTDEILDIIPLDINENNGKIKVKGVLFIPKQQRLIVREHGDLTIFCHRYFICDNDRMLLPKWARFVRGIIDTPSLKEMASREAVLRDDNYDFIQVALGKAILEYLTLCHKLHPERFREIVLCHNIVIKAWAIAEDELFNRVKNIVYFNTEDELLTLPQYFARFQMQTTDVTESSTKRIFYTTNPGGAGQQAILFKAKGFSVLDASNFPDVEFLMKYVAKEADVELHKLSVDSFDYIFEPLPIDSCQKWENIENSFLNFQITAKVVRFIPTSMPAILLHDDSNNEEQMLELLQDPGLSPTIKRLLQHTIKHQQKTGSDVRSKILYLNADNNIVRSLAEQDLNNSEIMEVVKALYYNALLLSLQGSKPLSMHQALEIFEGNNNALAAFTANLIEIQTLRPEFEKLRPSIAIEQQYNSNHVKCFVALPFDKEYNIIFDCLRRVLEDAPYFWEINRADEQYFVRNIPGNVGKWISDASCYAVDITDLNPNVMMELGRMYWGFPDRVILLLTREGIENKISDLGGAIHIKYPWNEHPDPEQIELTLREEIKKFAELTDIQKPSHFLSSNSMKGIKWIDSSVKTTIAKKYVTIERFLEKAPEDVVKDIDLDIPNDTIKVIQNHLYEKLATVKK